MTAQSADIRDRYPDITPEEPGTAAQGIVLEYQTVSLGGWDYYDIGLGDSHGEPVGYVRVAVTTFDKSITRNAKAPNITLDTAMNEAIALRISRSTALSKSGKPYWNVDLADGNAPTPTTAPKPAAPPVNRPAPAKPPVPLATPRPQPSVIPELDAAAAQSDRYEQYMDMVAKIVADKRLVATGVTLTLEVNAAAFTILDWMRNPR